MRSAVAGDVIFVSSPFFGRVAYRIHRAFPHFSVTTFFLFQGAAVALGVFL